MTHSRVALAAIALAALAGLGLAALALVLPRVLERPEMRRLAEESAARALGRPVGYERTRVGLLPPAIVLERPWIAGARAGDERLLEAESLALDLAIRPLLEGRFVVRSLEIEAPTLRVERGPDGLALPLPRPSQGASSGGPLAVERVRLRHARLLLRDAVVSPSVTTEVADLALEVEVGARGAPLSLEGSFDLQGGRVEARGTADADGAVDLALDFENLPLEAHAAYLGLGRDALAVRVDGEARLRRPARRAFAIDGRIALREGRLRVGDLEIGSGARARVALDGIPAAPHGRVEIDARAASVALPAVLTKPPGVPARLATRIDVAAGGAVACREVRIEIGTLSAEGEGSLDAGRFRLDLRSDSLDAGSLAGVSPQVGRIPGVRGPLALRRLHVETGPLVVDAEAELEGVSLAPGTPEPILLRGPIALSGETARATGLRVEVGGQPMTLDARVRLGAEPTFEVSGRMRGVDAKALLRGLLTPSEVLEGRLDLDAQLRGPLASQNLVETAEGTLRVHVAPGRIAGVSILESALAALSKLEPLGALGFVGQEGNGAPRGAEASGDRFRTLDGTMHLARGISRSDDLRIVYPTYDLALAGELDLVRGSVKMRGDLLLGEALVSPVGKALGLLGLGCAMPNRIPIPEISGPASDPVVRPDASYLLGFLTRCSPLERLRTLGETLMGAPRALGGAIRGGKPGAGSGGAVPAPVPDSGTTR